MGRIGRDSPSFRIQKRSKARSMASGEGWTYRMLTVTVECPIMRIIVARTFVDVRPRFGRRSHQPRLGAALHCGAVPVQGTSVYS